MNKVIALLKSRILDSRRGSWRLVGSAVKGINRARRAIPKAYHSLTITRLNGMIFARNCYGFYCIPADAANRPAARYIITGQVWERETIACMQDYAGSGDVVTAGAFFGDALPAVSSAAGAENIVWAFEPNPDNFRCSSITVLLNDLKNVQLVNAGLGSGCRTNRLITRDFSGHSLGGASQIAGIDTGDGERGVTSVPVRIVPIDGTVPESRKVSLIQLDIEGFEEFAILGAVKTIARCKPILILETVPSNGSAAMSFLATLNYSIVRRLDSENFLLSC